MKSGIQVRDDVMDELAWEPRVKETAMGVSVSGGVVTQVKLASAHERSDTDIANAAAHRGRAFARPGYEQSSAHDRHAPERRTPATASSPLDRGSL